jgi:hypothetical protein
VGDHGVAEHRAGLEGVQDASMSPSETTAAMVHAILGGLADVSVRASEHAIPLRVLDLGATEDFAELTPEPHTAAIDWALERVGHRLDDAMGTLTALGSADLAATTGFLLEAARDHVPVLIDGLSSVACALIADRIAPRRRQVVHLRPRRHPRIRMKWSWRGSRRSPDRWAEARVGTERLCHGCCQVRPVSIWPPCRTRLRPLSAGPG